MASGSRSAPSLLASAFRAWVSAQMELPPIYAFRVRRDRARPSRWYRHFRHDGCARSGSSPRGDFFRSVCFMEDSTARAAIKLLIVDDHPVVRVGLSSMLRKQPGLSVVGAAHSGAE